MLSEAARRRKRAIEQAELCSGWMIGLGVMGIFTPVGMSSLWLAAAGVGLAFYAGYADRRYWEERDLL